MSLHFLLIMKVFERSESIKTGICIPNANVSGLLMLCEIWLNGIENKSVASTVNDRDNFLIRD